MLQTFFTHTLTNTSIIFVPHSLAKSFWWWYFQPKRILHKQEVVLQPQRSLVVTSHYTWASVPYLPRGKISAVQVHYFICLKRSHKEHVWKCLHINTVYWHMRSKMPNATIKDFPLSLWLNDPSARNGKPFFLFGLNTSEVSPVSDRARSIFCAYELFEEQP